MALLSLTTTARVRLSPFMATLAANPTFVSGFFCLDGGAIIEGDAEFLCGEEVGFEDHVCFGRDAVVSHGVMHCSDDVCGDLPWSGGLVVSGLLGV